MITEVQTTPTLPVLEPSDCKESKEILRQEVCNECL